MYTEDDVIKYYDISEVHYRAYWKLDSCMAMHYGYHEGEKSSFKNALLTMNKELAKRAEIKKTDYVLDAGCGVGGSSIYLAKQYGCRVDGITLSEKQVETAKRYAIRHGVEEKVRFSQANYQNTDFADATFDVIWAIESVCHSFDKAAFYEEAYRLLKKGGRLIVADYLDEATDDELGKAAFRKWLDCWSIKSLPREEEVQSYLRAYHSYHIDDITKHILASSKYMHRMHYLGFVFHRLYDLFFKASEQSENNFQSAKYQYQALKRKAWSYRIITARK